MAEDPTGTLRAERPQPVPTRGYAGDLGPPPSGAGGRPGVPRRLMGATAGSAVLVGAITMTIALVVAPGPWTVGYVSEAGTAGMPAAGAYRLGLILVAAGVVALGAAVGPVSRLAALLLGVAGVLAGSSGAVPCSARCPLPPYEATTTADLVHSGASILGMAALAFAMVALAVAPQVRLPLRGWAVGGAVVTFPVSAAMALAMLLAGRAPLTGAVERALLAVAVCWLVGAAALTPARAGHRRTGSDRKRARHGPAPKRGWFTRELSAHSRKASRRAAIPK